MVKKKKDIANIVIKNLQGYSFTGGQFKSPGNIPTGHFVLDFVIGHGCDPLRVDLTHMKDYDPGKSLGMPLGKLVEVFGSRNFNFSSVLFFRNLISIT